MKRKTTKEFILDAKNIYGDKYDYSYVKYKNNSTPVKIICSTHGEFLKRPLKHLYGQGCPKCNIIGQDELIKKCQKVHNDKYDYSKVNYIDNKTKIEIICPLHGSFFKTSTNHLNNKQGCPKCSKEEYNEKYKKPLNEFIEQCNKNFDNKYDYSKVKYKTLNDKVTIICPKHGEFKKVAWNHYRNDTIGGCPKCLKENWITDTETLIARSKEIHGNKYTYEKTKFINAKTPVTITCPIHGDWATHVSNHIYGKQCGCKQCAIDSKRLPYSEFIDRCNNKHNNFYDYSKTEQYYTGRNRDKLLIICPKHGEFWQSANDHYEGNGCQKCAPSKSQYEDWLEQYLIKNNINYIKNDRNILNGLEIDFLLEDYKIGIEINGLRFHSEGIGEKGRKYHLNKTQLANDNGYRLIQLFSTDILFKEKKIKAKLNSILHKNKYKIYARKCQIKEIEFDICKKFLDKYHLQGSDNGGIKLGLFYKNKLVNVMTFSKRRLCLGKKTTSQGEYELSRFCGNNSFYVIGGASKLLKYFERNYTPTKIITYADKRFSDGSLYYNLHFNLSHESIPSYWYFIASDDQSKLYHRFNFRKDQLSKKLEKFDSNLTEWQNMQKNGWDRIWDCGNMVFEKTY